MKITITRMEMLELWNGLPGLVNLRGFKLGYAVARTKAKLKVEVEAIEEALKPDATFTEYEKKRLELCRQFAMKDERGEPLVQGNQFVFQDRTEFEAQLVPVNEQYADAIKARTEQLEGYTASLREPITVEVHQIGPEDVPDDVSVAQMDVLIRLIKAEE